MAHTLEAGRSCWASLSLSEDTVAKSSEIMKDPPVCVCVCVCECVCVCVCDCACVCVCVCL